MKKNRIQEMPTASQLRAELKRVKYKRRYRSALRSTVYALIVVAAIAILIATLWLPVLQISGTSMTPTLQDGEIVLTLKTSELGPGDVAAFYHNNKVLVKRSICGPGDWIDIDENGTVYVNEIRLEEPYLTEKALGDCNIKLPYQVPEHFTSGIFLLNCPIRSSMDMCLTNVGHGLMWRQTRDNCGRMWKCLMGRIPCRWRWNC